jgi:hypothetical protein
VKAAVPEQGLVADREVVGEAVVATVTAGVVGGSEGKPREAVERRERWWAAERAVGKVGGSAPGSGVEMAVVLEEAADWAMAAVARTAPGARGSARPLEDTVAVGKAAAVAVAIGPGWAVGTAGTAGTAERAE